MSVIPKGSTVLVTGVTGYIAGHVADQLLLAGYKVRGTTRSKAKAAWLQSLFDSKYGEGKFSTVDVPDMVSENAFDDAVKGVAGICHLASVLTFSNVADEVIPPTVKGTTNILASAGKESSVKSVVYTSSSTAALMPVADKVVHIKEDTWNDYAVKAAQEPNPDSFTVYAASKTEAERAFWKAAKDAKASFQVSAVLPNANFGKILKPNGEGESSTGSWIVNLFKGDTGIYAFPPQWFVDVQDTARLHVAALVDPSANGKRIYAFAAPYSFKEILAIFRKEYPDREFPADKENEGNDLSTAPNESAKELLQKHYQKDFTSLEESLKANVATLV